MDLQSLAIIIIIIIPCLYFFRQSYEKGLYTAVILLVVLTHRLRIEIGGGFPNLNIDRLILIILFLSWLLKKQDFKYSVNPLPFRSLLILTILSSSISLIVSVDFMFSIKTYFSLIIEIFIYYMIVYQSINSKEMAISMLYRICYGLTIVAIIAAIEKYTRFNPVDSFIPDYIRRASYQRDVMSTYPHRILLGVAMAMGWPIALALIDIKKKYRVKLWISIVTMIAGCYFAGSRGPWIASVMAAIIMYVLGSANTRKRLSWLIVATLIVLIMRPGVLATFEHMAVVTFDKDTLKGSSYEYRNELWRKAYSEVSKSTQRTIFGYGPGSSEVMDMSGKLSYSEYDNSFWSWDNQYACSLLETGFVGLISAIILYAAILIRLLAIYLKVEKSEKTLVAALIASIAVMIVMMMSVKIFAPQLYFIFWTLIAVALHITKTRDAIPQGV